MTFNKSVLADKDAHRIYHAKALSATQFPKTIPFGTNEEIKCVHNNPMKGERIVEVQATLRCSGEFYNKFIELRKFVDEQLGSNVSTKRMHVGQRAYVFLDRENHANGFLLVKTVCNIEIKHRVVLHRGGATAVHKIRKCAPRTGAFSGAEYF